MKKIDIENWNRKEHFEFFSSYDNPYFGIVTEIDCTKAYERAKEEKLSFFAVYLHHAICAVNKVAEFKLRILNKDVVQYDEIHAGSTLARKDGTFSFSFIKFSADFQTFNDVLQQEITEVNNSSGLRLKGEALRLDVIHFSSIPWSNFTGLTHPINFNTEDSVPKIVFGKAYVKEGKRFLPISVEAHHALVDGLHLSKFLASFQEEMNK
jgi:chloramphenicol O-acetyltransferase type A